MRAAKDECEPSLRVRPFGCHRPPTAKRGGFYPDFCDGCIDAPVKSPIEPPCCLAPQEYDETDDDDEARNCCNDEYSLCAHRLSPLSSPLQVILNKRQNKYT